MLLLRKNIISLGTSLQVVPSFCLQALCGPVRIWFLSLTVNYYLKRLLPLSLSLSLEVSLQQRQRKFVCPNEFRHPLHYKLAAKN